MKKPCCDKNHTNKGAWTEEEDQKLVNYIRAHGEGCWHALPKQAGLHRCGKSCRLRWINYLRPDVKRGNFAEDEEDLIVKLHALLGNRWSLIAGRLPGRTDNEVKNYWNSHIRRKLIKMGIDPQNHRLHQTHSTKHQYPRPNVTNSEDHHVVRKPRRSKSQCTSSSLLKSFGSKLINGRGGAAQSMPLDKVMIDNDINDGADHDQEQVSDGASSLVVDETSCSGELNLDLKIGFPSASQYPNSVQDQQNQDINKQDNQVGDQGDQQHLTLPLFL